jgi:hypothetical protein
VALSSGLADYACTQFPDDNNSRDTLIVGLIALAIALPVTLFCQSCFEMANDSECPESFLMWAGVWRYVFGMRAHRRWHYTGLMGQPQRFVRWYVRSVDAPKPETLLNLGHSLLAFVTRTKPPWTVEAEEAEEEAACGSACGSGASGIGGDEKGSGDDDARSHSSAADSAAELRRHKHKLTAMGLAGVFLIWAVFSWFIFTYGEHAPRSLRRQPTHADALIIDTRAGSDNDCPPFAGMLIYKLLGADSQDSFASSFGVSYAVGAVAEWQARPVIDVALRRTVPCGGALLLCAAAEHGALCSAAAWLGSSAWRAAPPRQRSTYQAHALRLTTHRTSPRRLPKGCSSWPSWSACTSHGR